VRERRNVKIRGRVQGVFFRETVRRIATRYDVHGFVRNVGYDAVEIDAEAEPRVLNEFIEHVLANPPFAAQIERIDSKPAQPTGAHGFSVVPSKRGDRGDREEE
jgi:acylphosphatase